MTRSPQQAPGPSRVLLALMASVVAGLVVAALAFPVVGGLGLAAKAGADDFLALPGELDTPALSIRSQVLASDGSVLATFYRVNRIEAPLDQIPQVMRHAIVAIEDSRFYEHRGVDVKGTLRAAVTNARSGRVAQGGSTLTQQYVKNALIAAAEGDRKGQRAAIASTAGRKIREARFALALEQKLPKDEILHRYLDIAYFGNGVYGIGTAAQYYFGVPVAKLSLAQSALLAGVVQNPTRYNVASRVSAVRADLVARRNTVLGRMRDLGYISEPVRRKTAASRLQVIRPKKVGGDCQAAGVTAPFFCDYVRHELEDTDVGAALGATREERQARLLGGGLTIRTSLDPKVQAATQKAVEAGVPANDPSGVLAASDVVEPGTGAIKAMAVDRPYGSDVKKHQTSVNFATGGSYGFQAGSTFKAFWLATALQEGLPLSTSFYSPAEYFPKAFVYKDVDGKPQAVHNSEPEEAGTYDLRTGTYASVNTFYIQLVEKIGFEKPLQLAESLGLRSISPGKAAPLERVPSAVLGTNTVTPLAMAGAYAAFAAHGIYCPPRAVLSISGPDSQAVPLPPSGCGRAMEADVADTVTSVLSGVVDGTDPHRTGGAASIGRPVAGKTGTTTSSRAAWFVGYTPQLASAVWVGKPIPKPLTDIRINNRYYRQLFGGGIPAEIFAREMRAASQDLPVEQFAQPPAGVGDGPDPAAATGSVPNVAGQSFSSAYAALQTAGFSPTLGRLVSSPLPFGRVTYTYPGAGSNAAPGTTVYIYRSLGSFLAPTPSARPTRSPLASPRPTLTPRPTTPPPTTTAPATSPSPRITPAPTRPSTQPPKSPKH